MADRKTKIIIETESGNSEQKLKNVAKDLKSISSEAESTSSSVSQSTTAMMGKFIALGAKVAAVTATIKKAYSMAREAAEFQETVLLTKSAAENMGLSFERLAEASKRGADGMADAATIMKANLRALKLGLNATEEEFGRLWEIANATGDELGQSIEQTFEQIVHAINTGNSRALVQLGVLPENFKKAANSADLLSSKADLLKTVLDQLGKSTDRVNSLGNTAVDKFQQFENACSDLSLTVKENLVPALTPIVEVLTEIIKAATKAANALSIVLGMKESKNPYLAYRKDDLTAISRQKRNEISQYRYYADIVSGKSNTPLESLTKAQRAEIFGVNKYNWASMAEAEEARLKQVEEALEHINKLEEKRLEIKKKQEDQNEKTKQAAANEAAQKAKEKAEREAEKAAEAAKRAAEKAREEYQKFTDEINNGFNRALGISNKSLSEFIELSYNAGMATLGFGGQVDKAAAELYELEKPFNDMLEEEEKLRDVQIALENIDSIKFENLTKASNNINVVKAANELWVGSAMGMASTATKVLDITKTKPEETIKKGWAAIKGQVVEGFSDAVTSGIINSNLGDALRGAISSIAASKAQSYGSNILGSLFSGKGIATGALSGFVGSIAIGAIANNWKKWFGDKGKNETMASNASTKERGSQAYLQTYAAMLNPYMTDEMLDDLYSTRWASSGMHVSWKSSKRGGLAGLAGGKNYTDTTPQSTYDLIKAMENAVDAVKKYNEKKEKELDLLSAQGYDYRVLTEQLGALSDAVNRANWMSDSYSHSWTSGEKFSIDLSDNIQDLKKAYYEALREYGEETGARNQQKANTFMSLYPYLDDYKRNYYSAGGMFTLDFSDSPYYFYNEIANAQTNLLDKYADPRMLEFIKQAGKEQFRLASMQYSTEDASKYTEAYLRVLERQKESAEIVMQQQEQIYRDMTRTFQEQQAALDTYQQAQDQYYNTKLEILAQEKAKEEQIKKEEQQAKLRSADRMEALLGFTGEIAKTNKNVYVNILEGPDQIGALREMEKYIDDPQALAYVQRLIQAATNKNKYGKIA